MGLKSRTLLSLTLVANRGAALHALSAVAAPLLQALARLLLPQSELCLLRARLFPPL